MAQNPYVALGVSPAAHLGYTRPLHAIKENWALGAGRIEGEGAIKENWVHGTARIEGEGERAQSPKEDTEEERG